MDIQSEDCKRLEIFEKYETSLIEARFVCPGCGIKIVDHLNSQVKIINHYNACICKSKKLNELAACSSEKIDLKCLTVESEKIVASQSFSFQEGEDSSSVGGDDTDSGMAISENETPKTPEIVSLEHLHLPKFDSTKLRNGELVDVLLHGKHYEGRIMQRNNTREPIPKLRSFTVAIGKERHIVQPSYISRTRYSIVPFLKKKNMAQGTSDLKNTEAFGEY